MEYCVNCKHYRGYTAAEVCESPKLPISLVNGKPIFALCRDQRSNNYGGCKEEGLWFEFPDQDNYEDLDDLSAIPFGR